MFFLLPLLPLLGVSPVCAEPWMFPCAIDFTWPNSDGLVYTFETNEPYTDIAYPEDSPSYPDSRYSIAVAQRDDGENIQSIYPPAPFDTIARLDVQGEERGKPKRIGIWWTPDRLNKDVVRKNCTLVFDDSPKAAVVWDLATATASARDEPADNQRVRDVTHFVCVDAPVEE